MISRFVLWNDGEVISSSQKETPIPQALPLAKRLAVRQHLMESGTGAEVVLDLIDGRPTLCIASGVTIDEMELSVRSYNCLKAASIEALDELLSWKPAQLMDLPNFGSKCLSEIVDIVHQLGYPSFGDAVVATAARPGPLLQANGVSLSVQQDHAGTGTSAEGAFSTADDPFILRPSSQMTIAEMELSVRAYNCLKAASIETLDELLKLKLSELMDLPHFGRKCLNEITEIVRELGYPHFGDQATRAESDREPHIREGSSPMACLLDIRELVPEGAVVERLIAHGWHNMADFALHSVETLVRLVGMPTEERLQLERALGILSLELPIDLPAWFLYNIPALRAAFGAELGQLKLATTHHEIDGSRWRETRLAKSLNEDLLLLVPKSYNDQKRKIISDLLGLGGKDPLTLDETAKLQARSITRERVRQIARPVTDALRERGRQLPWLLKAVALLNRIAPCRLKQAEQALIDEKVLVAAIMGLVQRSNLEHNLI